MEEVEQHHSRFLFTNLILLTAPYGLVCTTGFTYLTVAWIIIFFLQCFTVTGIQKTIKLKTGLNFSLLATDILFRVGMKILRNKIPSIISAHFLIDGSKMEYFAPIVVSSLMLFAMAFIGMQLKSTKRSSYEFKSRQRVVYIFEYLASLIPIATVGIIGCSFWSLPVILSSLCLLGLKAVRANKLYCLGRLLNYLISVSVTLLGAVYSITNSEKVNTIMVSMLVLIFSSTITVFWEGNILSSQLSAKPVYLDYIVILKGLKGSKILSWLASFDFIVKVILMWLWIAIVPSVGAVLLLLLSLYAVGFNSRRYWNRSNLACIVALAIDFVIESATGKFNSREYLLKSVVTVAIYFISEVSVFLQTFQVQEDEPPAPSRNMNFLFYLEILLILIVALLKVDLIKCGMLFFAVWFIILPSASRKFQNLFIVFMMTTLSTRFCFTTIDRYFGPTLTFNLPFIKCVGLDSFFSFDDVQVIAVYIVAAMYRGFLKQEVTKISKADPDGNNIEISKPSFLEELKSQGHSVLQNFCLPLLIISILIAALVSENFGLITIGYLMLFFWFSVRGMMKDYKERSVFLKFTTFYSAFALLVCYSFQHVPLYKMVERMAGKTLLIDMGLSTAKNISVVLSCYFAALAFSRMQFFYEYELEDRIEGFESRKLSWYIEFPKRFLLLHSSRIISISLTLSIVNDCSIFSIFNLVIALILLFTETLNRYSSVALTLWLAADILTKCVFHFEIFNRMMPFWVQVLGFKRTQYSHVFDTVFWQLIPLVVLAFQPALSRWHKELLEKYESIKFIPLLDEFHILRAKETDSEPSKYAEVRAVLASFIYYISFFFREFGREITCAIMYAMSVYNDSLFGCIFASITLICSLSLPRISHTTIIVTFIFSAFTLFFQYGSFYLLTNHVVPWKKLPMIFSHLLGLTDVSNKGAIILSFFACFVAARYYRLESEYDFESRFTSDPKEPRSFTVAVKKKLIIMNVWTAYILAFSGAVSEASIPSFLIVFFSLYFFRIGSNIYLQKYRQVLILNTVRYMIIWEGLAILLRIPAHFVVIQFPQKKELLHKILALAGIAQDTKYYWTTQTTIQVITIFLLILHDRVLKSPIASTIIRQLVEENRSATRRSDRFHLHRVEELKQQLEYDSAAADETKRRIKERSGLFSTIDIGDWLRVFHGGTFFTEQTAHENVPPSPNPVELNLTRRRVESFIESEEQAGLGDIRQNSLEAGPEELFSPEPENFTDFDENDYPYNASGEVRFYALSLYFWILRIVLKLSEDYRHICELKPTYQLVEKAKSERTFTNRMSILFLAIYYAIVSHTSVIVAICCLFNSIYYANVLSVIPSFLLLTVGACQRPYTRKTFWKQLIRYITIYIFVLFISQTKFFYIAVPKDVFKFAWSDFVGISGFDSELQAFFGPFLLLLSLMWHRAMMRFMGTWHIQETASLEERRLRRETVSSFPKNSFKFLDVVRGFADDFGGFLKSLGELPGKDYYLEMFLCDMISLVIACVNWNIFSGETIEEDMYFLKSVISNNTVPMGFVILTMIQALLLVLDRMIYCRKALKLKILMQLGTLGIYHAWVVFLVPIVAGRRFRGVFSLCLWYMFKFGYWYFSALQVKQGYPLFRTTNFLFKRFSLINYYIFLCIRSLPLFMEFRNIIDWTFTPSSLSIYMWFKFEQLFAMLYGIKSSRQFTDYRMGRRSLGRRRTQWWKHTIGSLMMFGLILLVFWPFIWLSLPGAMVKNPVQRMKLTIGLENFTLIDSLIFAGPAKIVEKSKADAMKALGVWPMEYGRSDTQIFDLPVNLHSKNLVDIESLVEYLEGKNEVVLWVKAKFTRGFNQPAISVMCISDFKVPARSVRSLIMGEVNSMEVHSFLPSAYNLKSQGFVSSDPLGSQLTFLLLYELENNSFSVQRSDSQSHELLIHSHKVSANRLSNYGIIGLYVTFVYAVARMLKNSLSNLPFRIPFEDLPSVDILYGICEDLIRVREFGDYYSEEYLYWQLIEIYRRPDQLLYLTKRQ